MLQQQSTSSSSCAASLEEMDGRLSPFSSLLHHKASSHPLCQLAQISIPPRASLSSQHQLPHYASPSLSPASASSTTVSPLSAASSASPSALSSPVPILSPHPVFHPACASRAMQPIVVDQYQLQQQQHYHSQHQQHQQQQQLMQAGLRGVRIFPCMPTSPSHRLPATGASTAPRMAGVPSRHPAVGTKRKMGGDTMQTSNVTAGLSLYAASPPPLLPSVAAVSSSILPSSSPSPSPSLISACVPSSQPASPQSGASSLASLTYDSSPQGQQEKRRRATFTPSPVAHISPRSLQACFPPHAAAAAVSHWPSASPTGPTASPVSLPSPSLSPLSSPSRTPFESPVPQRLHCAHHLQPSPSLPRRHFLIPPIAIPSPPPSPLFYCSPSTSAAASPSWLSSSCCSSSPPPQQQQQRSPFVALHPRYTVLHTLEQSLLSSVKLALDNITRRHVCIKIARVASAANLQREAELLRCLHSAQQPLPGLVELIEQLSDDEYCYLVTTWYERGDLFAVLSQQREQRLSAAAVQSMFASLVSAVHSLHRSLRVAHLDLSLENIVQAADDSVAIIDFGSAVFHPAAAPSPALSHPRAAASTLASPASSSTFLCDPYPASFPLPCKVCYCSPELLSHSAFDAYAADVFALGVILYTLSTGLPPFEKAAEDSDVWYRCISRGDWLRPELRQQDAARVYSEGVDERVLSIIDGCIKPEASRWSVQQLFDHAWVREGRERNQRSVAHRHTEGEGDATQPHQTADSQKTEEESKDASDAAQPLTAATETEAEHKQAA